MSKIHRENENLMNATSISLEPLRKSKNKNSILKNRGCELSLAQLIRFLVIEPKSST